MYLPQTKKIFSGKLEKFRTEKDKRDERSAIVEALAFKRKRKFEGQKGPEGKIARLEESFKFNDKNRSFQDNNRKGNRNNEFRRSDRKQFQGKKQGPRFFKRNWPGKKFEGKDGKFTNPQ